MFKYNIKFNGIYNKDIIKYLEKSRINSLGFDFYPKSLNFIQGYKFIDMMNDLYLGNKSIFLKYSNEKDFVVESMLEEMQRSNLSMLFNANKVFLEFEDTISMPNDYYDKFNMPYFIHYQEENLKVLESRNIKGIILENKYLNNLHNTNKLNDFLSNLIKKTFTKKIDIILNVNWGESILSSVFSYLDIKYLCFFINNNVEKQYRLIDPVKLERSLQHITSLEL
jgi:hypothetical protein